VDEHPLAEVVAAVVAVAVVVVVVVAVKPSLSLFPFLCLVEIDLLK